MLTTKSNVNKLRAMVHQRKPLLGIYFSAGYPYLEATSDIIKALDKCKVDFVEVGMPYSDPLADGPVIEACHEKALKNGMSIELMFAQIKEVRKAVDIPIVLMGYFNPVFKYGIERFCNQCREAGVDAVILPDLPVELYRDKYLQMFKERDIDIIFLATPETPVERLRIINEYSNPFVYLVSSSSTTGQTKGIPKPQLIKLKRVIGHVTKPVMVGFGISTREDFHGISSVAAGAIVGSAFLKRISGIDNPVELEVAVGEFVSEVLGA